MTGKSVAKMQYTGEFKTEVVKLSASLARKAIFVLFELGVGDFHLRRILLTHDVNRPRNNALYDGFS